MISKEVTVNCPLGLVVQPAGLVCKEAMNFKCTVSFNYDGGNANAKSMLSVLGACIKNGDTVELICDGEDEEVAAEKLTELLEVRLSE